MCNVNREHKNSVFTFLFSNPSLLRELYSAIGGVAIPPDTPVNINTLTDILFMNEINDLSFLIDNRLVVLIEHQSSINNNIPLRLLEYIGRIYEKIVDPKKKYQEKLEKIPKPEFIVLYNGKDDYPDYAELKLSDAFMDIEGLKLTGSDKILLELIVQVYNINHGRNPEILRKSKTLYGYSIFMDKIRECKETEKSLEKALPSAVKYCINNHILEDFLREHSSEVINMIAGEWDWDIAKEVWQREAWEDGHEEGREEGREEGLELVARNALEKGASVDFVQKITGLNLDAIEKLQR